MAALLIKSPAAIKQARAFLLVECNWLLSNHPAALHAFTIGPPLVPAWTPLLVLEQPPQRLRNKNKSGAGFYESICSVV